MNILSLGAGVQSSTIALMAEKKLLQIDCAIFADTMNEPKKVYKYLEYLKKEVSFPIHVVSAGNLAESVLNDSPFIPFFTDINGKPAIMKRQCTTHFKIIPINHKIKEIAKGAKINLILGISHDEIKRAKPNRLKSITNIFPLIEMGMTRNDCINWLEKNDYPVPPKSSCIFCPFHTNEYWKKMKTNEPDEFAFAVEFDKKIRDITGLGKTYLHRKCKPLVETVENVKENNLQFDFGCDEGYCFI